MGGITIHATGVVLCVIYLLPVLIALLRKHESFFLILLLDLSLGWTYIGWVFSLVMALGDDQGAEVFA